MLLLAVAVPEGVRAECEWTSPAGVRLSVRGPVLTADSGSHPAIGSGGEFPGQEVAQSWPVIDRARPVRLVRGTLTEAKHNCCGEFDDRDWNLFLRPDDAYRDVLTNENGVANANGKLETELRSADPQLGGVRLADHFATGQPTEVCGWWTSDWGHDPISGAPASSFIGGKAELHPINYVHQATGPGSFRLFAGQDVSVNQDLTGFTSRFETAAHDLRLDVEIPMPMAPAVHQISSGRFTVGTPARLEERLGLDYVLQRARWGSVEADNTPENFRPAQSTMSSQLTFSSVSHQIHFRPAHEAGLSRGVYPLLIGTFTRDERRDLTDAVTVEKRRDAEGRGYLAISVRAALRAASGAPYVASHWSYDDYGVSEDSQAGAVQHYVTDTGAVQFGVVYAPLLRHTRTSWALAVRASTRPWTWDPGARAQPDVAGVPMQTRAFYADVHQYAVEPTRVSLRQVLKIVEVPVSLAAIGVDPSLGPLTAAARAAAASLICRPGRPTVQVVVGATVHARVARVHPSVTYSLAWLVRLRGTSGYQTLQAGDRLALPGYTLAARNDVLDVSYAPLRKRREDLELTVVATTDVSEAPYADAVVRGMLEPRPILGDSIVVALDGRQVCVRPADVYLGLRALRGQPEQRRWDAAGGAARLTRGGELPHELYRLARELPRTGQVALRGLDALVQGRPVAAPELEALLRVAAHGLAVGRALPVGRRGERWPALRSEVPEHKSVLQPR